MSTNVIPIETPSLGDRSYVVTDGEVAVVIDPQRDVDRVLAVTESRGLRITHVFETHIHNDYVSGGYALARLVDAELVIAAADDVDFERRPVGDGDVLETGRLTIRVLATPGHTFHHLAYAVEADGEVLGVFTGGSLLTGSTGRPDLLGEEHAEELARAQHRSAHLLVEELPPSAQVFPTHGFGSFCSATQTEDESSTLDEEAGSNPALTLDEDAFVEQVLSELGDYPAYYAHMAPRNRQGVVAPDLSPPAVADPEELRRRLDAGEWVVDLRTRATFAAGHVAGTINLGLDGSFVTYLGWLIPWGTPVTLLAETADEILEAQRDLARIGIDRPAAAAMGGPRRWAGSDDLTEQRRVGFYDLRDALRAGSPFVLDVRRDLEWSEDHIPGSMHVPLHELLDRLDELPTDRDIWVHCGAGYRASVASSLLRRSGHRPVHVDDEFDRAVELHLTEASLPVGV